MKEIIDTPMAENMVILAEAEQMTLRWQNLINPNTGKAFPKSYRFDRADFQQLLDNDSVEYVRAYPAIKEDGVVTLIVVGVDADGNDILQPQSMDSGIYDFALPCPKTCGVSPLIHEIE